MNNPLNKLYEATGEDLRYGIGTLNVPGRSPVPYVHIHYADWSRDKLEVVRETFAGGLTTSIHRHPDGDLHVHLATRQRVAIECHESGRVDILRAPAWDACLGHLAASAFVVFDDERRRSGGFLLLVQTPEWEFLSAITEPGMKCVAGPIQPRSFPLPPETTNPL